jgi:hypothetical protein
MVEGNAFRLARSRAQYLKDIDDCMEALYEGNSYEICLTNALHCEVRNWDVWDFYKVLRKVNPAPYSAWLHCGEVRFLALCVYLAYAYWIAAPDCLNGSTWWSFNQSMICNEVLMFAPLRPFLQFLSCAMAGKKRACGMACCSLLSEDVHARG